MSPESEERDDTLPGTTQRVQTGTGKVYVIINDGPDGEPFEVFINTGSSGGYTNSWADALGMTISVALRSGADPGELAEKLMGTRAPHVGHDNGDTIYSTPDAVGVALRRHLDGRVGEPVRDDDDGGVLP